MRKKILVVGLSLLACCFLVTSVVQAGWYDCKIVYVNPRANGTVMIQFDPGTNEDAFVEKSRAYVKPSDIGANKLLATILTAVSLGQEVAIEVDTVPSWAVPQAILAVGMVAP